MATHHITAPSSNMRLGPYPTSHPNSNTAHTVGSVGPAQPSGHRTHPTNTSVSRTGPWWRSPGPLRSRMRELAQHDCKTVFNQPLAREVMIFGTCIRCRPGVRRHHLRPPRACVQAAEARRRRPVGRYSIAHVAPDMLSLR